MDAGLKEGLVHINIAQPADHPLIQQKGFDPPFFGRKEADEGRWVDLERVGTDAGKVWRIFLSFVAKEIEKTEFPHIPITQLPRSLLKGQDEMTVAIGFGPERFEKDLTGHFQVQHQSGCGIKVEKDELAFALDFPYDGPPKSPAEFALRNS
jgi:hypothetical protein